MHIVANKCSSALNLKSEVKSYKEISTFFYANSDTTVFCKSFQKFSKLLPQEIIKLGKSFFSFFQFSLNLSNLYLRNFTHY